MSDPLTLYTFADQVQRMLNAKDKYVGDRSQPNLLSAQMEERLVRSLLKEIEANQVRLNRFLAEQNENPDRLVFEQAKSIYGKQ